MRNFLAISLLSALSAPVSATCYVPFGEINAVQTDPAKSSGTASLFLTGNGKTTEHQGAVTGTVAKVNAQYFPTLLKYSFVGPTGSLSMTGTPNLSSLVWLDADRYSLLISVKINSGTLNTKKASGTLTMRGVANVVNGAESFVVTSGSICY